MAAATESQVRARLESTLTVVAVGDDVFRAPGPYLTDLPRTFGGTLLGQALMSAQETIEPDLGLASLHAYFSRPGDPDTPTSYQVRRERDGRTSSLRVVTGSQEGRNIFHLTASYLRPGDGPEHQDTAPAVPLPRAASGTWGGRGDYLSFLRREWADWEFRPVPTSQVRANPGQAARQAIWVRYRHPLPDRPGLASAALAYLSDIALLSVAKLPSGGAETAASSLDHAVWFHRPVRMDRWLLFDQASPSAVAGRGLVDGYLFDEDGSLVASVRQEGLIYGIDVVNP